MQTQHIPGPSGKFTLPLMSPELKQRIQLVLAFAILFYQRRSPVAQPAGTAPPLEADYYVVPKKLYPFDLKSARQLTQQPVWVKEGYRYTYYPYQAGKVDFAHEAGLLLPIERLEIK